MVHTPKPSFIYTYYVSLRRSAFLWQIIVSASKTDCFQGLRLSIILLEDKGVRFVPLLRPHKKREREGRGVGCGGGGVGEWSIKCEILSYRSPNMPCCFHKLRQLYYTKSSDILFSIYFTMEMI